MRHSPTTCVSVILLLLVWNISVLADDQKQIIIDLIQAASRGETAKIQSLLQQGASVNARHPLTGWTPLIAAALYGHVDTVRVLIQAGADVNAGDKNQSTPLMKSVMLIPSDNESAVLQRKAEIIEILLKSHADPQKKDAFGETPWQVAIRNDNVILVEAFENAKVKGVKETQLMLAIAANNVELAKTLISDGADVNYRDESGANALSESVLSGNIDLLRMVIDANAELNAKFEKGWTSLMFSAQRNRSEMVRLLLQSGADPSIKNDLGLTALQIAELKGNSAIAEILKKNGK